eukprot:8556207-Lingulodinium_polyedra.AAC.1
MQHLWQYDVEIHSNRMLVKKQSAYQVLEIKMPAPKRTPHSKRAHSEKAPLAATAESADSSMGSRTDAVLGAFDNWDD